MAESWEYWTDHAPEAIAVFGGELRDALISPLLAQGYSVQEALLVCAIYELFHEHATLREIADSLKAAEAEGEEWKETEDRREQ